MCKKIILTIMIILVAILLPSISLGSSSTNFVYNKVTCEPSEDGSYYNLNYDFYYQNEHKKGILKISSALYESKFVVTYNGSSEGFKVYESKDTTPGIVTYALTVDNVNSVGGGVYLRSCNKSSDIYNVSTSSSSYCSIQPGRLIYSKGLGFYFTHNDGTSDYNYPAFLDTIEYSLPFFTSNNGYVVVNLGEFYKHNNQGSIGTEYYNFFEPSAYIFSVADSSGNVVLSTDLFKSSYYSNPDIQDSIMLPLSFFDSLSNGTYKFTLLPKVKVTTNVNLGFSTPWTGWGGYYKVLNDVPVTCTFVLNREKNVYETINITTSPRLKWRRYTRRRRRNKRSYS